MIKKIKQYLPWYKINYLEKKDWKKRITSHYIFYYFKNSLAEENIERICREKGKQYKKITSFLGVSNKRKIKYYIYPSLKAKKQLMGDDSLGNAIWEELILKGREMKSKKFEVHAVYSRRYKFIGEHEDTHLLSLSWGLSIYLLQEGLAQFMEGNLLGKDIDSLSREIIRRKENYSIYWLFDNKNWENLKPDVVYPLVGSFIKFLINKYGKSKFKKVYRRTSRENRFSENLKIMKNVYLKSIKQLEREWIAFLKKE